MPIDESVLNALSNASKFSSAQLDRIANSVLGASLSSISNESMPERQAQDMIAYAKQYDLLRELAAAFLYTGADKPGLQNLLLGEHIGEHMSAVSGDSSNYIMLRVEAKLDQAIAEQARQAALLAEVVRQQTHFDRRLYTVESSAPKPMQAIDRMFLAILAILLVGMFAYNVIGNGLP